MRHAVLADRDEEPRARARDPRRRAACRRRRRACSSATTTSSGEACPPGGSEEAAQRASRAGLTSVVEALERLVVERCRAVDVDVIEAEVEVGRPLLGDQLGRAERAVAGAAPAAVALLHRGGDLPRLLLGVADDRHAALDGALDLRLVAADLVAPAAEHLVLVPDALEVAAGVPARRRTWRPCASVFRSPRAADQDRQVRLHGRRVVQHVLRVVEAARAPRPGRPGASRASARPPRRTSRAARRSRSRTRSRARCARSRTRRRRSRDSSGRRSCGRAS